MLLSHILSPFWVRSTDAIHISYTVIVFTWHIAQNVFTSSLLSPHACTIGIWEFYDITSFPQSCTMPKRNVHWDEHRLLCFCLLVFVPIYIHVYIFNDCEAVIARRRSQATRSLSATKPHAHKQLSCDHKKLSRYELVRMLLVFWSIAFLNFLNAQILLCSNSICTICMVRTMNKKVAQCVSDIVVQPCGNFVKMCSLSLV